MLTESRSAILRDRPVKHSKISKPRSSAPAGTPATVVNTLRSGLADVLAQPAVTQAIIGLGGLVQSGSPAELADYQRAEYAKWGEVVRLSGARMN